MIGRLASLAVLVALCYCCDSSAAAAARSGVLRQLQDQIVGDTSVCAKEGERSVQCGGTNAARPDKCCEANENGEGLGCVRGSIRCTVLVPTAQPTSAPVADGDGDGDGDGDETEQPTPAPVDDTSTEQPTPPAPPADENCAAEDERAQDCGATSPDRPQSCCAGLACPPEGTAGVRCVVPPPTEETAAPTPSPTVASTEAPTETVTEVAEATTPEPTTASPTAAPTGEPTTAEPTSQPTTKAPTDEPTLPPTASTAPTDIPIEILRDYSAATVNQSAQCAVLASIVCVLVATLFVF